MQLNFEMLVYCLYVYVMCIGLLRRFFTQIMEIESEMIEGL